MVSNRLRASRAQMERYRPAVRGRSGKLRSVSVLTRSQWPDCSDGAAWTCESKSLVRRLLHLYSPPATAPCRATAVQVVGVIGAFPDRPRRSSVQKQSLGLTLAR